MENLLLRVHVLLFSGAWFSTNQEEPATPPRRNRAREENGSPRGALYGQVRKFGLLSYAAHCRLSLPPPSPQGGSMCHVWKCAKCHQVHKVAASNSKLCNLIMNSFSYVLRGENFFKMGTLIVRQSFPSLCLRSAFRTTILLWRVCGITALNKLLLLKSLCYENAIW